jgi:hypothetical protein
MRRGRVAQLGERLVRNEEAGGSNPLSSTIFLNKLRTIQVKGSQLVRLEPFVPFYK